MNIIHALVASLYEGGEMFTNESIKQCTQYKLLKIPAIYGAAHLVGDSPDGCLQFVPLFCVCHYAEWFILLHLSAKIQFYDVKHEYFSVA